MSDSDDSDYIVEQYVKPDKIGKVATNDESADILGNFDDQKRKNIENNVFEEEPQPEEDEEDDDEEEDEDSDDAVDDDDDEEAAETTIDDEGNVKTVVATKRKADANGETKAKKVRKAKEENSGQIGEEQIVSLLRGVSKANRFVLYVTNLNFGTDKERLAEYFGQAGGVKTVRIPKKRKGGFAFVEMTDVKAFKVNNAQRWWWIDGGRHSSTHRYEPKKKRYPHTCRPRVFSTVI